MEDFSLDWFGKNEPGLSVVHQPAPLECDDLGEECEYKQRATKTVAKAGSGIMLAWFPPPELARQLAMEGYEDANELHVTLAYFGKEMEADRVELLRQNVAAICASAKPLKGELGGVGRFPATESSDNKDVIVLLADVPYLESLRERILLHLSSLGIEAYRNHGYSPHMTLAYVDPGSEFDMPRGERVSVTVGAITLAVAGEREEFELKGIEKGNDCHDDHGRFCSGSTRSYKSISGDPKSAVEHVAALTEQERAAVSSYKGVGYHYITGVAMNNPNLGARQRAQGERELPLFESALSKSKLKEDSILYRGLPSYNSAAILEAAKTGKTFKAIAFQSTSTSESIAKEFVGSRGGVLLKIHAPKGTKALAPVANEGINRREKELVLSNKIEYRILRDPVTKGNTTYLDVEVIGE